MIVRYGLYRFGARDPAGVIGRKIRQAIAASGPYSRYLKAAPNTFGLVAVAQVAPALAPGGLQIMAPPKRRNRPPAKRARTFRPQRIAYAERDEHAVALGQRGEALVLAYERAYLRANGRPDLVERVRHASLADGDGAGYDILSYDLDGAPKYIEVKTAIGGSTERFKVAQLPPHPRHL